VDSTVKTGGNMSKVDVKHNFDEAPSEPFDAMVQQIKEYGLMVSTDRLIDYLNTFETGFYSFAMTEDSSQMIIVLDK
jgi:hypothetical protein